MRDLGLVQALVDSAGDREEKARNSVISSLINVGKNESTLVLVTCVKELSGKHDKLSRDHRIALLVVMTELIKSTAKFDKPDVLKACIDAARSELESSKDIIPEWQTPASNVLVAAGIHDCSTVMKSLLELFKIDHLPHYFILHTVANLAAENSNFYNPSFVSYNSLFFFSEFYSVFTAFDEQPFTKLGSVETGQHAIHLCICFGKICRGFD